MSEAEPGISDADLVAFADGRLDPAKDASVAAWLDDHPDDRDRIERWRSQADLLRAALDPVTAEPMPAAVPVTLEPKRRRWLPIAAAAAGIVLGFSGGLLLGGLQDSPIAREIAAVGLSAHEVYVHEVRHPIEVTAAEEAHLVAWLSNRLDAEIIPPDLSDDGLSLLGGRVVPRDGDPAAMLMYEDVLGERFTLLIARSTEPETTSFRYTESTGAAAYYWMNGTIGYVFSGGPDDRDRLLRLSGAVYDQMD